MIFVVLWGLITHGTYAGTGDEPHYQIITHSLAFDGDIDLTTDYSNPDNLSLGGHFEGGAHVQPGSGGQLRPVHDIGMPLLFAPYYLFAYMATEQIVAYVPAPWLTRARLNFTVLVRHLMSFAMIALTAWTGVQLLELFTALSANRRRAFAWVLLLVLSPPIMSHSFLYFTEIVSAVIALAVFRWLRAPKLTAPADGRTRIAALLAGAAMGFLLLVHARNAGLIAGLTAVALVQSRRWSDRGLLVPLMIGAALLFAVRTGVTYHFWGTWLTTPHARLGDAMAPQPFAAETLTRIVGWLFDQEHGLLPYAPIYLLVPSGWIALWKRNREACAAITLVIVSYVAVIALPVLNAHGWRGGWTPAARFLVPIAPFLAVLAFAAVAFLPRVPAIVVAIASVQVCLDAILWQRPGLLWNDGIGRSALLNFIDNGTARLSYWIPSIVPPLGPHTIALVAGAGLAWALLTMRLKALGARGDGSEP